MTANLTDPNSNNLDLRCFFRSVKRLRKVYYASIIIFAALALTYCIVKQPQYEIHSALLIEEPGGGGLNSAGGMANIMRTFSVGGFGGSSVNNELQLVNSHDVLINTAKALGLNRTYMLRDGLSKRMLFLDTPIAVEASAEMLDTLTKGMKITVDINGEQADIKVTRGLLGHEIGRKESVTLPATVETPFGALQVLKTSHFTGEKQRIEVSLGSYESAADFLATDIKVDLPDKLADAIGFDMLYPNKERGRAILNTLMAEYNAKRLNRQHSEAHARLEFLDSRINALFGELSDAEQKIETFKADNRIVNIEAEAPLLLESSLSANAEMVKVQAEVAYYREVLDALSSPKRAEELLPVFDSNAYPMIKDYNDLLIEKKELERSATPSNPELISARANLAQLGSSVTKNVESMLRSAETLLTQQRALASKADARINRLPAAERDYVNLTRDLTLKNELYAYLAAERESAAMQIANNDTLGFIVDPAYASIKPSRKKAILACIACLVMALFCPSCLAAWLTLRHKRVTDPMDLASCGLEDRTVIIDSADKGANPLRTRLLSIGRDLTLYVSGDAEADTVSALARSYGAIDAPTALITPTQMNLPLTNDSLLLPEIRRRVADIKASGVAELTMISVPQPGLVGELAPLLSAGSGAILLLAYRRGAAFIADIRALTSIIDPESIIFVILD